MLWGRFKYAVLAGTQLKETHQTSARYVALRETSSKLSSLDSPRRSYDVIDNPSLFQQSRSCFKEPMECALKITCEEKPARRVNLSLLALISFVASFADCKDIYDYQSGRSSGRKWFSHSPLLVWYNNAGNWWLAGDQLQ